MTRQEYMMAPVSLGAKLGYIGRLIHAARYCGSYCRPAAERYARVTRLRRLYRRLALRLRMG